MKGMPKSGIIAGSETRTGIGFRLDDKMKGWLDRMVAVHGLSRSEIIRRVFRHHMRHSKHRADMVDVLFGE
ncbi:unnamed protein product [marine sediment metagenome]|uniref:Ribbon-helix-helix protein CopG domain-containing protein n=1 Tax=marine sediment metagenome TaxID=412755 RepID=X1VG54_9ZZZZ